MTAQLIDQAIHLYTCMYTIRMYKYAVSVKLRSALYLGIKDAHSQPPCSAYEGELIQGRGAGEVPRPREEGSAPLVETAWLLLEKVVNACRHHHAGLDLERERRRERGEELYA